MKKIFKIVLKIHKIMPAVECVTKRNTTVSLIRIGSHPTKSFFKKKQFFVSRSWKDENEKLNYFDCGMNSLKIRYDLNMNFWRNYYCIWGFCDITVRVKGDVNFHVITVFRNHYLNRHPAVLCMGQNSQNVHRMFRFSSSKSHKRIMIKTARNFSCKHLKQLGTDSDSIGRCQDCSH